ncbi:MAG: hypothetical protein ACREIT_09745 [Tepidisphaeraceae bacterium]
MSTAASEDPKNTAPDVIGEDEIKPHVSLMQKRWVQTALPFATSLMLHVGLIAAAIATIKVVPEIVRVVQEQIIIPDATIIENAPVGGIPNPGLGGDPNRAAAQDQVQVDVASEGWSSSPSQQLTQTLMGGGSGDSESASMIGIGGAGSIGGKGKGVGSGSGDGSGAGGEGGGGGPAAPFGVPGGGGGIGPKSPFMGISGNAKMVIYLCDASGSMMTIFDKLQFELRKAIDVLRPIQAFNIIFFSGEEIHALDKTRLVMANPENKKRAYNFVEEMRASSATEPLPAIRMAFKQNPQLIYILTDGFDAIASYEALLSEFRKLNKEKTVKINTILVGARSDDPSLVGILKTIAEENGGTMKIVSREEFR